MNGLYGETSRANTEEKANLLADSDFQKAVRLEVDSIMHQAVKQRLKVVNILVRQESKFEKWLNKKCI